MKCAWIVILSAAAILAAGTAVLGFEILDTAPLEAKSQQTVIIEGTRKVLNRQYEEVFSLAKGLDKSKWFFVDLKAKANVNIFGKEGRTIAVTYPFMPLGRQVYYGVPFDIIAPEANENRTAIALPSNRLLPRVLKPKVEVEVSRKSDVLFFLYATYYTVKEGEQSFTINYTDGSSEKLPFVGKVHSGDWWHPNTRVYSQNIHYVLVPAAKGAKTFFRNMHSRQWKNPHPDKEIKSVTFVSDPKAPMAIIVVAITGHSSGDK